jgi:hypothetical protein
MRFNYESESAVVIRRQLILDNVEFAFLPTLTCSVPLNLLTRRFST